MALYQRSDKNHEELKLLIERRQDLKQMLVQEMNRFQAPLNTSLQKGIKTVIICLEKQVTKIEESINKIIEQNENLSRKKELVFFMSQTKQTANA